MPEVAVVLHNLLESKDKFERLERVLSVVLEQISKIQIEQNWLDKSQLGTYLNVHEDTAEKMAYRVGLKPKKKKYVNQLSWVWKRSEVDTMLIVDSEKWRDRNLKDFKTPRS